MASKDGDIKKIKYVETIQCSLLQEDVDAVVKRTVTNDDAVQWVALMAREGYAVYSVYDQERGTFGVCLQGVSPTCTNAGKWMWANANEYVTALAVLIYKHEVIFGGEVWTVRRSDITMGMS